MDFTFENQGTNTYLVYKIGSSDRIDSMSLGMLTNNKITGLAPALFTQMDSTKYIKYNVSSKIAVKQFFSGPVNKKRLVGVFLGIVNAMLSAEEYMIDSDNILLDMDYIFADVSTCDTVLICLPLINETKIQVDIGTMFKNIVFNTQFDRTENCDYVAKLINYLNSMPVFSLMDFREVLNEINGNEIYNNAVNNNAPNNQNTYVEPLRNPQPVVTEKKAPQQMLTQNKAQVQPEKNNRPIPQIAVPQSGLNTVQVQEDLSSEKTIGLFGLLTHYNKENAQIYKEQKQRRKDISSSKKQTVAATNNQQPQGVGFAIPGQPAMQVSQPGQQPQQALTSMPQPQQVTQTKQEPQLQQAPQSQQIPQSQKMQQFTATAQHSVSLQPANFGETTVLGGGIGETTVLGMTSPSAEQIPYMIRGKNNEKILVDKPVFRIGKEKSYVDYFIGDNTTISRSHANIITRNDEYFIVDTNSTNHTFINGSMIQSNIEIKLSHGTKIRLSNEEFEFRLY